MKNKRNLFKRPLLLASMLLLTLGAFAQRDRDDRFEAHERFFRIGAKAGVNINKIQGQSYRSGFNYNYLLGAFMQFNFSRTFGLQPEFNFVQSSSQFANSTTDIYDDLFLNGSQKKAKLDYLKVPLLLNINLGPSRRVKLQLGPQYGNVLSQTIDSLKSNGNIFKTADWAGVGGLWIQLPFINIGARYEVGLSNLNAIDQREKWKSQAITVFAGFTF
ncbi:MAG: PorT family protein [Bacteroidota bacterium]|nr:PorT family protein [Bacteroidota bacterium]